MSKRPAEKQEGGAKKKGGDGGGGSAVVVEPAAAAKTALPPSVADFGEINANAIISLSSPPPVIFNSIFTDSEDSC